MLKIHPVFRSSPYHFHIFSAKEAQSLGLEKAIILNNIQDCNIDGDGTRIDTPLQDYYIYFPYISKERFTTLLGELLDQGFLKVGK